MAIAVTLLLLPEEHESCIIIVAVIRYVIAVPVDRVLIVTYRTFGLIVSIAMHLKITFVVESISLLILFHRMWLTCHVFMIATITLIVCRLEVVMIHVVSKIILRDGSNTVIEACRNIICVITIVIAATIHDVIFRVGCQLRLTSIHLIVVNTTLIHVNTRIRGLAH